MGLKLNKKKKRVCELASLRDDTICSLGRERAFASSGGERRPTRERVIDVGSDTEVGLQ